MKMRVFVLMLAAFLFVVGCEMNNASDVPEKLRCETDKDCFAAECCHAASCVNVDFQPDCKGIMCTMSCEPETMDCGQGKCVCENGGCVAKIE